MPIRLVPILLVLLASAAPIQAQEGAVRDAALDRAIATFETALPGLSGTEWGVDVAAYRDALTLQQFRSAHWGGTVRLDFVIRAEASGPCGRFAAFTRIPPENGAVQLVLCPQFFTRGADALRELTVLHEVVHAVAGAGECRAMAFAARVEQAARGQFTPVDAYWQANGCATSAFSLPD